MQPYPHRPRLSCLWDAPHYQNRKRIQGYYDFDDSMRFTEFLISDRTRNAPKNITENINPRTSPAIAPINPFATHPPIKKMSRNNQSDISINVSYDDTMIRVNTFASILIYITVWSSPSLFCFFKFYFAFFYCYFTLPSNLPPKCINPLWKLYFHLVL